MVLNEISHKSTIKKVMERRKIMMTAMKAG